MLAKTPFYTGLITFILVTKVVGLMVLVCSITFIDMFMGLYVVYKVKDVFFSWGRLIEGFLKMILYSFFIVIAYEVSLLIFEGILFGVQFLTPKVLAMLFVVLEVSSIERKREKLGKKPILQTIRAFVKVLKEFHDLKKNFKK
jgi:hypothetical protein